jgi:hypothetical protein
MRLRLKSSDFANLILNFLLDKIMHPDDILESDINPEFNAVMDILDKKGVKSPLLRFYMSPENREYRVMYKRIRGVFTEKKSPNNVEIAIERDERPEKKGKVLGKLERLLKKFTGEE